MRNAIFADAYGADPEFFEVYRSLTAYTRALQGGNSSMVMSPDSEFFNYLKSPTGAAADAAAGRAVAPAAGAAVPAAEEEAAQVEAPETDAEAEETELAVPAGAGAATD